MNTTRIMMWNIKVVLIICAIALFVLSFMDLPDSLFLFFFGGIMLAGSGWIEPSMYGAE